MLLTREEQIDTLHAAATSAGVDIAKEEIHWEDGFLEVDGLKLHYLDWGGAGKTPLLLLHGGLQTAHSWDLTAVVLKRDFHIVALDLRGHGDSDWAPQYSFADHANDLAALVEHLGWDRLVLIGLSLGGLASMSYAAEHHGKLKALVFVDVGPELAPEGREHIGTFIRSVFEVGSLDEFVDKV
ncbi:MAG: alpha/beta hydrolase, partial [Dehalococcoidia bacterium]|nr:alpha/beta hydrolase [Dehalococcoidia bacterium]